MADTAKAPRGPVTTLSTVPASDVKRRGWRGVMRTLSAEGAVVITNHNHPEAVILAADAYTLLLERANRADEHLERDLADLRDRFDERLAALRKPDAGQRLRAVMQAPAKLRGKVKAGETH